MAVLVLETVAQMLKKKMMNELKVMNELGLRMKIVVVQELCPKTLDVSVENRLLTAVV